MYRVLHKFYDLKDDNHAYSVGDRFPHNGVNVDEDRLAELSSDKNRLGVPLIVEVEENQKKTRKKKSD